MNLFPEETIKLESVIKLMAKQGDFPEWVVINTLKESKVFRDYALEMMVD